jgi:hypothetical protein
MRDIYETPRGGVASHHDRRDASSANEHPVPDHHPASPQMEAAQPDGTRLAAPVPDTAERTIAKPLPGNVQAAIPDSQLGSESIYGTIRSLTSAEWVVLVTLELVVGICCLLCIGACLYLGLGWFRWQPGAMQIVPLTFTYVTATGKKITVPRSQYYEIL